jgi:hypothetical protein
MLFLGKFNPRLEQHIVIQELFCGRRVLRSGGPNYINHHVHAT